MDSRVGDALLVLSGAGYPITQLAIRRFGRRGAAVVEVACLGLLARDALMIAHGAPKVLRPAPAALLWLECAAGAVGGASSTRLVADPNPAQRAAAWPCGRAEVVRRLAIATLFGLHTARFWIYLRPAHGRRLP